MGIECYVHNLSLESSWDNYALVKNSNLAYSLSLSLSLYGRINVLVA